MADQLPEPKSRKEEYLATAAGMTGIELPKPASREEQYLNAIAENGGGGGGGYVLPTASASTLGGVKVGENLSIDANGVLSASGGGGGEAGAFKILTSADYNYPADNPSAVALWLLPNGIYYVDNTSSVQTDIMVNNSGSGIKLTTSLFMVFEYPQDTDGVKAILCFGNPNNGDSSGNFGLREYMTLKSDGTDWGGYVFNNTSL